ncbi:breast carcinoma-amplified sequence 1 [Electrophorus electricus]|uniref:breast carcinoma-amplified sequence 1 n=1 Tax=Electrophorus electricus TaxID=8005 RepID=UPI0015D0412B|nr:breast carcinoma-amplified sequence 1 [Electrophorus electricus]
MGHKQSVQITPQQTDCGEEKNPKNSESNGQVIANLDLTDAATIEVAAQLNCESAPVTVTNNITPSPGSDNANGSDPATTTVVPLQVSPGQDILAQTSTPAKEEAPKPVETARFFKGMFKKKAEAKAPVVEGCGPAEPQITAVVQTDSQKSEPPAINGSAQAEKELQVEAPNPSAAVVAEDIVQPDDTNPEENSVMNFFKTFKSQKGTPAPPAANVQEASKVLPPPPPAPPKMESRAEVTVKKEELPPAEATAAAAGGKEPAGPHKAKAKASSFGKLFRPKSVVKEAAQPVEVQVDASKSSTLEAAAKPELPPAPKPEEQKPEKKPSPFASLLKPKVLLDQVSSKIQMAASSAAASVSLGARGAATTTKKEDLPAPTAAEATSGAKVKEEPKSATPAPVAPAPDTKSVESADNPSPSVPRKQEKRNSIHLFFKNLGQKRHSSDAGVQTEPPAPEKTK